MDKNTEEFIAWLSANGCRYDKIKWPTTETESGSRGAVAMETICTNEVMLEVPKRVMMCESQVSSAIIVISKCQIFHRKRALDEHFVGL